MILKFFLMNLPRCALYLCYLHKHVQCDPLLSAIYENKIDFYALRNRRFAKILDIPRSYNVESGFLVVSTLPQ
jgi:hypothetical protein